LGQRVSPIPEKFKIGSQFGPAVIVCVNRERVYRAPITRLGLLLQAAPSAVSSADTFTAHAGARLPRNFDVFFGLNVR
jgi:hypothetical protein